MKVQATDTMLLNIEKNILPRYDLAPKTALFVDTKLCKNNDDVVVVEVREMIAALPWVIVICMED